MAGEKYICSNCGNRTMYSLKGGNNNGCICGFLWMIGVGAGAIGLLANFIILTIGVVFILIAIIVGAIGDSNYKTNCCPYCKAENVLMPIDSPKGAELMKQYYPNDENEQEEIIETKKSFDNRHPIIFVILIMMIVWILGFGFISLVDKTKNTDTQHNTPTTQTQTTNHR